jgi:hypothetical protein
VAISKIYLVPNCYDRNCINSLFQWTTLYLFITIRLALHLTAVPTLYHIALADTATRDPHSHITTYLSLIPYHSFHKDMSYLLNHCVGGWLC